MGRTFRAFADQTRSDRRALAACLRGSRRLMTREEAAAIAVPVLIAVGTKDDIAGSAHELGRIIRGSEVLDIPGRDHMRAVGDKVYKEGVLACALTIGLRAFRDGLGACDKYLIQLIEIWIWRRPAISQHWHIFTPSIDLIVIAASPQRTMWYDRLHQTAGTTPCPRPSSILNPP